MWGNGTNLSSANNFGMCWQADGVKSCQKWPDAEAAADFDTLGCKLGIKGLPSNSQPLAGLKFNFEYYETEDGPKDVWMGRAMNGHPSTGVTTKSMGCNYPDTGVPEYNYCACAYSPCFAYLQNGSIPAGAFRLTATLTACDGTRC